MADDSGKMALVKRRFLHLADAFSAEERGNETAAARSAPMLGIGELVEARRHEQEHRDDQHEPPHFRSVS